ncbi:MAG: signal recognition particle-docking protein FtsY [Gammaproteobacteria bacterium]|nr:MAG: signal recognition particle-docking protein FtsY [Gammaproteobacteria bacterium]
MFSSKSTEATSAEADSPAASAAPESRKGFFRRLRERLNQGESWLTYDLAHLLPGGKPDEAFLEEMETRLLSGDVGVEATTRIMEGLDKKLWRDELKDARAVVETIRGSMLEILGPCEAPLEIPESPRPFVILMVGVNGAGKTTTIGKLARRYKDQGLKVMLAAGDTFRAAAVEQLKIWGERNDVPVVAQQTGADPAAVMFDALEAARARGIDLLIGDTAGRLHTQDNLMEELKKVKRVMGKIDPDAPHETLIVLDASLGQNALVQATRFHEAIGLTGIVMTKLDGTAKGGVLIALAEKLGVPIRYIGIGETAEDLDEFRTAPFVSALLGGDPAADS